MSGSDYCAEGIERWHCEVRDFTNQVKFLPLLLQYHPRLVAAGYLHYVIEKEKEKERALKVPEQLG